MPVRAENLRAVPPFFYLFITMRKLLLSAFAAFSALALQAQQLSSEVNRSFDFVPAIFSCNNETIILETWRDEHSCYYAYVFSGPLAGTQFTTGGYADDVYYHDLDNCTDCKNLYFTQNLFNDDEYFEWIHHGILYSSNGTSKDLNLGENKEYPEIYKINGQYYLYTYGYINDNYDRKSHLYLIKSETASIETVPADAPEARLVYSLSGHRQNDMQQGINIVTGGENGPRKVLKR